MPGAQLVVLYAAQRLCEESLVSSYRVSRTQRAPLIALCCFAQAAIAFLTGPVLGWTSAVAAYGAFIIPKVFGGQIKSGTPEYALYGFAVYYLSCLAVNWWYYARKNAEIHC